MRHETRPSHPRPTTRERRSSSRGEARSWDRPGLVLRGRRRRRTAARTARHRCRPPRRPQRLRSRPGWVRSVPVSSLHENPAPRGSRGPAPVGAGTVPRFRRAGGRRRPIDRERSGRGQGPPRELRVLSRKQPGGGRVRWLAPKGDQESEAGQERGVGHAIRNKAQGWRAVDVVVGHHRGQVTRQNLQRL